jgi:hypothetical protein
MHAIHTHASDIYLEMQGRRLKRFSTRALCNCTFTAMRRRLYLHNHCPITSFCRRWRMAASMHVCLSIRRDVGRKHAVIFDLSTAPFMRLVALFMRISRLFRGRSSFQASMVVRCCRCRARRSAFIPWPTSIWASCVCMPCGFFVVSGLHRAIHILFGWLGLRVWSCLLAGGITSLTIRVGKHVTGNSKQQWSTKQF